MHSVTRWLRQPLTTSLPLSWRLQLYAVCAGLLLASVPFVHLYLDVELSAADLVIHSLDITLGILPPFALLETAGCVWQRRLTWHLDLPRWRLLAVLALAASAALPLQALLLHDVLPGTAEIRAKHVEAGYRDMSVRVLPVVGVIAVLVTQWLWARSLRREVVALRRLSERLQSAVRAAAAPAPRVCFRHDGSDVWVEPDAISHVGAEENYCRITVEEPDGRELLVRSTLGEALARLPGDRFVQVHRSHVVGLRHVSELVRSGRAYAVRVGRAGLVPVSRSRASDVKTRLEAQVSSA